MSKSKKDPVGERRKNQKDLCRYHFLGGGICSIYYAWLVSGCKESVVELTDMIRQVATLPQSSKSAEDRP